MDVRTKILGEATRLFAAQGVEGTALQQIADAVGVRKPSLLYHFPSKEALHESVLGEILSRWSDVVPRLLHAVAREDRVDALLDATIAFFTDDPDRARLLLREGLDRPHQMRALLQTHVTPWLGLIAESIRKAQKAGAMRKDVDPEAYVLQVINLVVGTFTVGQTMQILLGTRKGLDPRLTKELKRVARAALVEE